MNYLASFSQAVLLLGAAPCALATTSIPTDPVEKNATAVEASPDSTASDEIRKLQAEIDQKMKAYGSRKKFISSGSAQGEYKTYLDLVSAKIVKFARNGFPKDLPENLDGARVIITIAIARDGSLRSVQIQRSSGNSSLDNAISSVVKAASPFPPIPALDDIDELSITRSFVFRTAAARAGEN